MQTESLGQVQVWTGEVATSFSLDVVNDPKYGLTLHDPRDGKNVSPKSKKLGFNRTPNSCHDIVLDNLPDEFCERLTAAGYYNVKPHG